MYSEKVIEHFKNPEHTGEIEDESGVGKVGNPACGDVMHVSIKVENGIIKKAKFKTFGCAAAIASSDMVCELVEGMTIEEALNLSKNDIVKALDGLPPLKIHCSVLGIDALKKAIEDYQKRNGK